MAQHPAPQTATEGREQRNALEKPEQSRGCCVRYCPPPAPPAAYHFTTGAFTNFTARRRRRRRRHLLLPRRRAAARPAPPISGRAAGRGARGSGPYRQRYGRSGDYDSSRAPRREPPPRGGNGCVPLLPPHTDYISRAAPRPAPPRRPLPPLRGPEPRSARPMHWRCRNHVAESSEQLRVTSSSQQQ